MNPRQEFEQLKTDRLDRIAKESAKRVLDRIKLQNTIGHLPGPTAIKVSAMSTQNQQPSWASAAVTSKSVMHVDSATNRVIINHPLEVSGRDILKELDEMRDALLLLKRDVDMESKYPRLKEIKDEYEQALEKYKTFERLK
jgi:hypothetical protein